MFTERALNIKKCVKFLLVVLQNISNYRYCPYAYSAEYSGQTRKSCLSSKLNQTNCSFSVIMIMVMAILGTATIMIITMMRIWNQRIHNNLVGIRYDEQGSDTGGSLCLSQPLISDEETQNFKQFQISQLLLLRKQIAPPYQELTLIQTRKTEIRVWALTTIFRDDELVLPGLPIIPVNQPCRSFIRV